MKSIKIGIMGCTVENPNMGCMALTYSLVKKLQKIGNQKEINIQYMFFDYSATETALKNLSRNLNMDFLNFEGCQYIFFDFHNLKSSINSIKKTIRNIKAIKKIRECAFIIDMTQGDSFSDIYGEKRFYDWTGIKRLVELCGVPLVLGPQTYGPFEDEQIKKYAKTVIENADLVISRDEESKKYLETFCKKDILVATDLAFELPYKNLKNIDSSKIKIGINPSGLLCNKKNDKSAFNTKLKVDYESYLYQLVEFLKKAGKYEIYMIPHVGNEAIECFGNIKDVKYHEAFSSPIEAKSFIAEMDIFIGARMHATIGAFSSGVATIPVAYSRKFRGLFKGIGYEYLIDLSSITTEKALEKTIEYIQNYSELKHSALKSMEIINQKCKVTEDTLSKKIMESI